MFSKLLVKLLMVSGSQSFGFKIFVKYQLVKAFRNSYVVMVAFFFIIGS